MMMKPLVALAFLIPSFLHAADQPGDESVSIQENPEEIVITGSGSVRERMMAAEAKAYALFNQFNDEKRFHISCDSSITTGTHFKNQVCEPRFIIEARSAQAREYHRSLANLLGPGGLPDGSVVPESIPAEALIAGQLPEYREKLKKVAEDHPEFLESLKEYSLLKETYESSSASWKE